MELVCQDKAKASFVPRESQMGMAQADIAATRFREYKSPRYPTSPLCPMVLGQKKLGPAPRLIYRLLRTCSSHSCIECHSTPVYIPHWASVSLRPVLLQIMKKRGD